jgi:transposase
VKKSPDNEYYTLKKEGLSLLEGLSEEDLIDIYYADESRVCENGYVPYGWQFADETVGIKVQRGKFVNIFGMISRDNRFVFETSEGKGNTEFVVNVLDKFVESLTKPTVIVLDNASIHTSAQFKEKIQEWEKKDLFIFYLPPYSPHLNICERVWKELKARWIRVQDYADFQTLKLRIMEVLANIGIDFLIDYQKFEYS